MNFYCVVQEYYDDGHVTAHITNHAGAKDETDLPKNYMQERAHKDIYFDYFTDKAEAVQFCDDALKA